MEAEQPQPGIRDALGTPSGIAALLLGVVLTAIVVWWSLDFGGFFPTVLYPGLILLLAVVGLLLPSAPLRLKGRGPHLVALGGMFGLSAWTLISILWSPTPDAALEDGFRTFAYGTVLFSGLWLAVSLGSRSSWSLGPVVIGGGVVAVIVVIKALIADSAPEVLSGDGTLDYPIGYRNAEAAYFFVVFWTAAGACTRGASPALARGACGAVASLTLALAVMSQSRGSIIAAAVALIVFVVTAGDRRRMFLALLATAAPVAIATPILIEPFNAVGTSAEELPGLHHAALAALAAALVGGVLMVGVSFLERGLTPRPPARIGPRPRTAVILTALVVLGAVAITATSDPKQWIDDRVSEFEQNSLPELTTSQSRFSVSASSTRSDYWRVALDEFEDSPLLGDGGGGFEFTYLRERTTPDTPRDAHSAPLEVLGELGLTGLLLLVAGIGGAATAAIRSRRFGSDATLLTSVALTVTAYWLIHASIDWFWSYPMPTAMVFGLLGSAAAASSFAPAAEPSRGLRRLALATTIIVSLAVIPLYLSERLTVLGVQNGVADRTADAYRQLDTAADLDPLADTSLLAAAELARRNGADERALAALDRAESRQPDNYLTYLIRARVLAPTDADEARRQLLKAAALNPRDEAVRKLEERLDRRSAGEPG